MAFIMACSKSNSVQPVSGSINGVPAQTLYGSSGKATDYIFLSTVPLDYELSYGGQTYMYYYTSGNNIFIMVTSTVAVKGSLTKTGSKTSLSIDNSSPSIFASTEYTSK